ncbi:hypothetical protein [Enterobacter kobei]|uniref:hypothetical protein n=1 Tax=Enterobacter kobei TaxID=208224 RepID=UPI00388EE873
MNDNAHFETVFTTFPLLHFGMIVAALSYITFAVMMNFIKRSQFLKEVLDGKSMIYAKMMIMKKRSGRRDIFKFYKWDRKRCIIQS